MSKQILTFAANHLINYRKEVYKYGMQSYIKKGG